MNRVSLRGGGIGRLWRLALSAGLLACTLAAGEPLRLERRHRRRQWRLPLLLGRRRHFRQRDDADDAGDRVRRVRSQLHGRDRQRSAGGVLRSRSVDGHAVGAPDGAPSPFSEAGRFDLHRSGPAADRLTLGELGIGCCSGAPRPRRLCRAAPQEAEASTRRDQAGSPWVIALGSAWRSRRCPSSGSCLSITSNRSSSTASR